MILRVRELSCCMFWNDEQCVATFREEETSRNDFLGKIAKSCKMMTRMGALGRTRYYSYQVRYVTTIKQVGKHDLVK